jgi:hypothetical protein
MRDAMNRGTHRTWMGKLFFGPLFGPLVWLVFWPNDYLPLQVE